MGKWIAICYVAVLAVTIIAGSAGLMILQGRLNHTVAVFMAMAAICLLMIWPAIRSRGPQPFDPETLPLDDRR